MTASIRCPDSTTRYINGIVTHFFQAGRNSDLCRYGATIRPNLWLLTQTTNCRIFQNKSVPKILEEVFEIYALNDFQNNLKGSYKDLDYVVQYNETAFDFVSRLMEEYGIFYYFVHNSDNHMLVLGDDANTDLPCPSIASNSVRYLREEESSWSEFDIITECIFNDVYTSGQVSLADYNFANPTVDLKVTITGENNTSSHYEYPGRYDEAEDGNSLARIRLEEMESNSKTLHGQSLCRGFIAGHRFKLSGFYREDANGDYVLKKINHGCSRHEYKNFFEAFPLSVPFRPGRKTSKPIIPGAQTAIVVGPNNKEIWTDNYGRVKVQFHWDQEGVSDDNSSCWVRVSQAWAGKSWGTFFLPRIGMEVVVEFLEGDPDRPIITGTVYNGQQTLPYSLPEKQATSTIKSQSTEGGDGFNEIRLDDTKEKEEFYLRAQKDMNTLIQNDLSLTVESGNEVHAVKKGNRTVNIDEGNETHSVAGIRNITVTKEEIHKNENNFSHTVEGNYVLTISGDLTIDVSGNISLKSGQSSTYETSTETIIKAGSTLTTEAGGSHTSKSGTSMTLDAGTSLKETGGTSVTIEAGTSAELSTSGSLDIKGSLVSIN